MRKPTGNFTSSEAFPAIRVSRVYAKPEAVSVVGPVEAAAWDNYPTLTQSTTRGTCEPQSIEGT
jgi:hypothetical protein